MFIMYSVAMYTKEFITVSTSATYTKTLKVLMGAISSVESRLCSVFGVFWNNSGHGCIKICDCFVLLNAISLCELQRQIQCFLIVLFFLDFS